MSRVRTQLVIDGQNNTKKAFDEVDGSLTNLSGLAVKAGAALAGALSVGVLANWVKESALATAQMARMAELSGATAEEFQRWAYASRTVGIEQDKLGDIFKDVQDKIGDFLQTGGGPMADFFENIAPKVGVTAEQFRNLSGPDALQLYVSSLEQANLSQSEMTFYMEAIANDATLLLPLLRNNATGLKDLAAEAEELGLVLSSEAAAAALEFERGLNTLGAASDGAGKQIAAELVPTLNTMNGLLIDSRANGEGVTVVANVLSGALKVLATAAIVVSAGFRSAGSAIAGLAAAGAAAATGDFAGARTILADVASDYVSITEGATDSIGKLWNGVYEEQGAAASETYEQYKALNEELVAGSKTTSDQLKEQHKSVAAEAKKRIREITAAEREANSEVERLRKERMEIEERYSAALAGIQAGSVGDPSLMQFNALKVGARQSLADGDVRGAQQQAQAALKVLQDLAAAGENTAGFSFFIRELKDIEVAAKGVEQSAADQKLEAITKQLEALKEKADIKITAKMSDEEIAKTQQQIKDLAAALSAGFVITPTIALDGVNRAQLEGGQASTAPGFAGGGKVTGPGTGTSDSILARLSNGEYVMRAAAVRQYGTAILDRMNGLQMPAFADGGLVEAAMAVPGATPGRDLGRVTLNVEGQRYEMLAEPQPFEQILRRQRVKFGRPRS